MRADGREVLAHRRHSRAWSGVRGAVRTRLRPVDLHAAARVWAVSGVLFSVAADSYEWAVREIRGEFGRDMRVQRVGADLGRVDGPSVHALAEACDAGRIMFVRHLTVEIGSFDELPPDYELADMVLSQLPESTISLAVQGRPDGAGPRHSFYPERTQ